MIKMPMEEKFTHFVTSRDFINCKTEILSDAFGIEVLTDILLSSVEHEQQAPDERIVTDLFEKIRKETKVH